MSYKRETVITKSMSNQIMQKSCIKTWRLGLQVPSYHDCSISLFPFGVMMYDLIIIFTILLWSQLLIAVHTLDDENLEAIRASVKLESRLQTMLGETASSGYDWAILERLTPLLHLWVSNQLAMLDKWHLRLWESETWKAIGTNGCSSYVTYQIQSSHTRKPFLSLLFWHCMFSWKELNSNLKEKITTRLIIDLLCKKTLAQFVTVLHLFKQFLSKIP